MQCLDRKRSALNALATLLDRDVARDAVDRAIQSTAQLAPVTDCSDGTALLAAFPAPPLPLVPAVQAAQHDLDAAVALESLGRYREAVAAIETLAAPAKNLAYPPLTAAVQYWHARALRQVSEYGRAETIARSAIATAATAKDDTLAADAWFELLNSLTMQDKKDEAARLDSFAAVAVARAGNSTVLQSRLLNVQGTAAFKQLDLKTARARYERSLALGDRNDPRQWVNVMNLGMLSQREGNYADARRVFEELVAQYERDLGPDHPETARVIYNLALAQQSLGELAEARTSCERSLRIRTASLGAEDPRTADSLEMLGFIMSRQGDPQAETQLRRALQIKEKLLGPRNAEVARMLANLAEVIQGLGKLDEATDLLRRALAIKLEVYGPKHPHTAYALHGLGVVLVERSDYVPARQYLADALESFTAAHGPDHPTIAYVLVGLGRCDLELGRVAQAVGEAERALAIREKSDRDPQALAEASFLLGRTLWAAKRRDRATELVKRARALYESAGPGAAPDLAKVEAWALAHR
jgi:serine/threonine-protein kinase